MEPNTHTAIVLAWQEAVNQKESERLLSLSDPTIEIVGPRGSAYGHDILHDWLGRAGLSMESQRLYANDDTVVTAGHGVWRSVETGDLIGEAEIASHFRVKDHLVNYYARYDALTDALNAAGLTEADEQPLLL